MGANPKPELVKPVEPDAVTNPAAAAAPDPFDITSLRLNPSFLETAGVKKLITTVPVKRPSPQDFFRVHPAAEYRENFAMVDLKDDREEYVVHPSILPELTSEVVYKTVFTVINRQGVVSLWPIRLPAPDDRADWGRSAREAAVLATRQWVRLKWNTSLRAYDTFVAESVIADPVWPELPFPELVRVAFREGRIITTLDHPVIKRLRGLA